MKSKIVLLIVIQMIIFQSCSSQILDVDAVIDKYNNTDFTELKNKSVYYRSTGNQRNSSIYFAFVGVPNAKPKKNDRLRCVFSQRNS